MKISWRSAAYVFLGVLFLLSSSPALAGPSLGQFTGRNPSLSVLGYHPTGDTITIGEEMSIEWHLKDMPREWSNETDSVRLEFWDDRAQTRITTLCEPCGNTYSFVGDPSRDWSQGAISADGRYEWNVEIRGGLDPGYYLVRAVVTLKGIGTRTDFMDAPFYVQSTIFVDPPPPPRNLEVDFSMTNEYRGGLTVTGGELISFTYIIQNVPEWWGEAEIAQLKANALVSINLYKGRKRQGQLMFDNVIVHTEWRPQWEVELQWKAGSLVNGKTLKPGSYDLQASLTLPTEKPSQFSFSRGPIVLKAVKQNRLPSTPFIQGPRSVKVGETASYTFSSIDRDGDALSFRVSWRENCLEAPGEGPEYCTEWGEARRLSNGLSTYAASHRWDKGGTYRVTVSAIDGLSGEAAPTSSFRVRVSEERTSQWSIRNLFGSFMYSLMDVFF